MLFAELCPQQNIDKQIIYGKDKIVNERMERKTRFWYRKIEQDDFCVSKTEKLVKDKMNQSVQIL